MLSILRSAQAADELLASCALFAGLSPQQRAGITALIAERRLAAGEVLIREGEAATELLIVLQGAIEVRKRAADGDHRIATLGEGATIGEMSFLDGAPRSASAHATGPARVGVLSMDDLARLSLDDPGIERRLLRNLAAELSRRLRATNVTTADALAQHLELERKRALMGRFVVFMTFMMVTYTFLLRLASESLPAHLNPSAITVPIILAWSGALVGLIRRSGLPFDVFGVTLRQWRPALREALLYTALTCAVGTLAKMALIERHAAFANERLFNLSGILDPRTSWSDLQLTLGLALVYAAGAPLQEFIIRGGLQTALQRCLIGRSATWRAIVVSSALFASAHLHLSIGFAVVVFFPGLLWGALFARRPTLVGVAVSHVLSGWFAFLVLGFEPWY
jgi:CRP-like cAMP-binding protein